MKGDQKVVVVLLVGIFAAATFCLTSLASYYF